MKAVTVHQFGPPEQLEIGEIEVPHAKAGQIQVRIAAASINPLDLRLPRGDFPQLPVSFPHVPGNDFAGTVTEVGEGVTGYAVGDEVFGHAVPHALRAMASPTRPSLTSGTLAEFAVFEADTPFIAHRPETLSVEQAAALPTAGITALALLKTAGIQPHETVLVVGATGGVGTTVLPLLAKTAKRVIATAKPEDADLLRGLGAEVIDYGAYPQEVDVALNLVLPSDELNDVADSLKSGGRLFTITFPLPQPGFIDRDDVRFELVLDVAGDLAGMAEVTGLTATIGRRYPFEQAGQAIADFANRHTTGKLVVLVQ
jgi:NADPH:quinone reductase-like Zn-dependent oxidoreductase